MHLRDKKEVTDGIRCGATLPERETKKDYLAKHNVSLPAGQICGSGALSQEKYSSINRGTEQRGG